MIGNIVRGTLPATVNQLRGNKNVRSVEELEAGIKQMVGIQCEDNDIQANRDEHKFVAGLPHDPDKQYQESYTIDKTGQNDGNQEQIEDMSAFKKFVSTSNLNVQCNPIYYLNSSCFILSTLIPFACFSTRKLA